MGGCWRHHREASGAGRHTWWQDEACWLVRALPKLCSIFRTIKMTHTDPCYLRAIPFKHLFLKYSPFVSCECSGYDCQSLSQNKSSSSFILAAHFMSETLVFLGTDSNSLHQTRILCTNNEEHTCISSDAHKMLLTYSRASICASCFIGPCHRSAVTISKASV